MCAKSSGQQGVARLVAGARDGEREAYIVPILLALPEETWATRRLESSVLRSASWLASSVLDLLRNS